MCELERAEEIIRSDPNGSVLTPENTSEILQIILDEIVEQQQLLKAGHRGQRHRYTDYWTT